MSIKTLAKRKVAKAKIPSNSPQATVNRAGGVAFEIKDPALKLVTMTGGSFFSEPKFYNAETCIPSRGKGGKFDKLVERLAIVDDKLKGFESCNELNDVAREVIATAVDVAKGQNPEDLLAIANWLRNEMNIRLTPQVLLVIASRMDGTKSLVRKYAPTIVKRPDEVKTCLLVHRFLFGLKSLSNGLNMGLGDAVSKFGEKGLMKYDSTDFPKWKDVLCWIRRKAGWPLKAEVAKYFITGEVVDASKTPVIAARKELAKLTKFDAEAKKLAKASFVNWEVLLSQFKGDKKALWTFLIEENLLGYMAMLRNLRNILEAKLDSAVIQKVSIKISSKDEVLKSKQLPFRFLSALKALQEMNGSCDTADLNELSAAIELASNEACANIPVLPGITAIFADNSGSMSSPVSEKSQISCKDAANVLCGVVAKVCERPYVFAFGTDVGEVRYTKNDTVLRIAEKVAKTNIGGYNTNGHKCVQWLINNKLVPDRVIFLSDMQMWNDGGLGQEGCLCDSWNTFKKQGGKGTWLHSVHLNGSGDNVVNEGEKVNQVGGFSEKVFTMLLQTEGAISGQAIPTVEQIREKWTVKG